MFKNVYKSCLVVRNSYVFIKRQAGHSKWQNIRHIKGTKDAQRSALFARLSRMMKVAVVEGGSTEPKSNLQLEQAIEQAKRANMPTATIQSVLKSSESDKSNSKKHLYDIRGPGGSMILCEVFSNNLHSLKMSIATILRKHNCKFSDGGGLHMFEQKGIVVGESPEPDLPEDKLIEKATDHAIEAGAEDVRVIDTSNVQFVCGATNVKSVVVNLENLNYKVTSASVEYIPLKVAELSDSELEVCASLYQKLENLPEVTRLCDNIA